MERGRCLEQASSYQQQFNDGHVSTLYLKKQRKTLMVHRKESGFEDRFQVTTGISFSKTLLGHR